MDPANSAQPLWQNPAFWVSILSFVVAAISAVVSYYTLRMTHLSPFRLIVLPGSPRWRREQVGTRTLLTLTLPLLFANTGARGGEVRDLIMEMRGGGDAIQFQPRFFADPGKYGNMSAQKSSFELSESDFYPLTLTGREQVRKIVVFTPMDRVPFAPSTAHTLDVLINVATQDGESDWTRDRMGTFEMPAEGERSLESGNAVVVMSQETRRQRESIALKDHSLPTS